MFLDLRDQWPPVPPQNPLPETGKPQSYRRVGPLIGLIVVINLGLLLVVPFAGSAFVQAIAALLSVLRH